MCTIPNFVSCFMVRCVDRGKLYIYSELIKKYILSLLLASPMSNALLSTGSLRTKVGQNKNFIALMKKFLCLVGDGIGLVSGMGQGSGCGESSTSGIGDSIGPR